MYILFASFSQFIFAERNGITFEVSFHLEDVVAEVRHRQAPTLRTVTTIAGNSASFDGLDVDPKRKRHLHFHFNV